MDLKKFYKEDHTIYKIIVDDVNANISHRRMPEEFNIRGHGLLWNEQGMRLSESIMAI